MCLNFKSVLHPINCLMIFRDDPSQYANRYNKHHGRKFREASAKAWAKISGHGAIPMKSRSMCILSKPNSCRRERAQKCKLMVWVGCQPTGISAAN
jgi:hypothetical protein